MVVCRLNDVSTVSSSPALPEIKSVTVGGVVSPVPSTTLNFSEPVTVKFMVVMVTASEVSGTHEPLPIRR